MVTVLGKNMALPPLYSGNDVKQIIIRDSSGKAMLLILNISDDTWGVSSSTDDDWKIILERYGVKEYLTERL